MTPSEATIAHAKASSELLTRSLSEGTREEAERIVFLAYLQGFKAGVESERPLIVRLATNG